MANQIIRSTISLISFLLIYFAILAPIFQYLFGFPSGEFFYKLLSPICHQYPTRCLFLFEHPSALCARCLFGYFGLLIAALFIQLPYRFHVRFKIGLLLLTVAVTDPLIQLFTVYESNNLIRIFSGLIGGIAFFLIINPFNSIGSNHEKNSIISFGSVFNFSIFHRARSSKTT